MDCLSLDVAIIEELISFDRFDFTTSSIQSENPLNVQHTKTTERFERWKMIYWTLL